MTKAVVFKNKIRLLAVISTIACTGFFASFAPALAQLDETRSETRALEVSLGSALASGTIGGTRFVDRKAMQVFYGARENRPYWLGTSGPYNRRADDFVKAIEESWKHGLNPFSYHLEDIRTLMDSQNMIDRTRLELLLTDGFVRYAQDLTGMRIDASTLKLDSKDWQQPVTPGYALDLLLRDKRMGAILNKIEPRGKTYKRLQKELIRLSKEPEEPYAFLLPLSFGKGLMKPGWRHKSIPDLRVRLGVDQHTRDAYLYDDALAAAVMKFQREHNLLSDGIIGSSTLQALNRTNRHRVQQLIVNMERLRWINESRPDRFVVVNIPSATLWAVDNGRVEFEMPVIVGNPARPTNSFITEIEGVRFNPDWTIPPTIKRFDILPKAIEDPGYLVNKGIEVIKGRGENAETLDPTAIDWEDITWPELNALRMVQIPGDHNPLGRVRVLMPNKYNIYLHDTNKPELFDRPERALSSGCIRLYDPPKMAEFIMEDEPGWDRRSFKDIRATNETTDIPISTPIPVYVLYYTAWVDDHNRVVFGTDIYKQDRRMLTQLENVDGLYIPGHNDDRIARSGRSKVVSAH